jgi:hypothetical protein
MQFLFAAALAGSTPHPPVVQARAMVRILSGARVAFHGRPDVGQPRPRAAIVYANGVAQAAKLIEFE